LNKDPAEKDPDAPGRGNDPRPALLSALAQVVTALAVAYRAIFWR
jgi:hypothetical protein